jgi:hypothetical protein
MASDAANGSNVNPELLAREGMSISRLGQGVELDPRSICIRKAYDEYQKEKGDKEDAQVVKKMEEETVERKATDANTKTAGST